jgi:hypothetical protein
MAYLLIVVGVSAVGIVIVLLRQRGARGPRTMDASIDHFSRTRSAIAPKNVAPKTDEPKTDEPKTDE